MKKVFLSYVFVLLCVVSSVFAEAGIIYRNPRVYNVEYSFEMFPDPNQIDRSRDLKLWVPIPREWDSQKAVKIVSVEPEPHAKYVDPEYGNPMLFWDFGKEPEKPSHKVKIIFRLEQYETYVNIDPNQIGPYEKMSKDYVLNTQSTNTISITDKVKELAKAAVGGEKNPYLQAKRIYEFIRGKMYYGPLDIQGNRMSVEAILDCPVVDRTTGQEYYHGACYQQSIVFIALCRSVGIPARNVYAWPGIRRITDYVEKEFSIDGLSVSFMMSLGAHAWAEIYLPNFSWVPVDPSFGGFGHTNINNKAVIITKGRDVRIGPDSLQMGEVDYIDLSPNRGSQEFPLHNGRIGRMMFGVFNKSTNKSVKVKQLHLPDPFPADALAEYMAKLYPESEANKNLLLYRRSVLRWIDKNTREHTNKIEALTQAYKKEPRAQYEHEAFVCHMLRRVVGNKKFFDIVGNYTNLRVKSGEPVSTKNFQRIAEKIYGQPLDWFFSEWIEYTELPQIQLDTVRFSQDKNGWQIHGTLRQLNKSLFRFPVELVLETEVGAESKRLWVEDKETQFEFRTVHKPKDILVDPNDHILQIREMPPLLQSSSYDEIAFCTISDQVKADFQDWTPLHFAAEAGQTDIVKYLIANGADVHAKTNRCETPIQLAADKGHIEVVEFLITKGAHFSIHSAARLGDAAKVMSLINDGAEVNAKNMQDETPLHIAVDKGHKEVAELLIAKGAKVDTKREKYPPLSWAVWNEDRDMIKLLVTNGADVNFVAEDDWPYLHYMVRSNDKELVEFCVTHGAKLNLKDDDGQTALHHAANQGYEDIVEYLISKDVDVDVKDDKGKTPLQLAKEKGHAETIELLKKHGAKE